MEKKVRSIRDLYLAATLVTLGFEVSTIDYQIEGGNNGEKMVAYFIFEETPEIVEAEKKFWSKKLSVEPQAFINSQKGLRSQITASYKSPRTNLDDFRRKE